MAIYYVIQNETYDKEKNGGYVWSPQLNAKGRKNAGYTMMTEILEGDFILHHFKNKIVAISLTKNDCYEKNRPSEYSANNKEVNWSDEGYRVDTDYFTFDKPIDITKYQEFLKNNHIKSSAFTVDGKVKQQYICQLADEHAILLLKEAISQQNNQDVLACLQDALSSIVSNRVDEYDHSDIELINELTESTTSISSSKWEKEKQKTKHSSKIGKELPLRDPKRATEALVRAEFQCEYNKKDKSFLRKNGRPYTEPHHLIPISKYKDFDYSVDVGPNIVSLCSNCHNLLHYGRFEDKKPILKRLYEQRKDELLEWGLNLTLEKLESYYK